MRVVLFSQVVTCPDRLGSVEFCAKFFGSYAFECGFGIASVHMCGTVLMRARPFDKPSVEDESRYEQHQRHPTRLRNTMTSQAEPRPASHKREPGLSSEAMANSGQTVRRHWNEENLKRGSTPHSRGRLWHISRPM